MATTRLIISGNYGVSVIPGVISITWESTNDENLFGSRTARLMMNMKMRVDSLRLRCEACHRMHIVVN